MSDKELLEKMPDLLRRLVDDYLSASKQINAMQEKVSALVEECHKQAEDSGLWFDAMTAPEADLQEELRKLHALIEVINE